MRNTLISVCFGRGAGRRNSEFGRLLSRKECGYLGDQKWFAGVGAEEQGEVWPRRSGKGSGKNRGLEQGVTRSLILSPGDPLVTEAEGPWKLEQRLEKGSEAGWCRPREGDGARIGW